MKERLLQLSKEFSPGPKTREFNTYAQHVSRTAALKIYIGEFKPTKDKIFEFLTFLRGYRVAVVMFVCIYRYTERKLFERESTLPSWQGY